MRPIPPKERPTNVWSADLTITLLAWVSAGRSDELAARLVRGAWPSWRHDVKSARVCRVFKNGAGKLISEFGRIFCAIKLSAKLVFLGNGILVIPFFDIGKWLFILTLKLHLNNVLRVMFTLRDRRILRENCYCPRRKSVFISVICHREI